MNKYLAKSLDQSQDDHCETIVEHTNNLLDQYQLLKQCYPDIFRGFWHSQYQFNDSLGKNFAKKARYEDDWKLLQIACAYHDLGKMNTKFQKKVEAGESYYKGEIPHALLSITMLPINELEKQFSQGQITALIYAIKWHHERDFSEIDDKHYADEIESLKKEFAKFDYSKLNFLIHPQVPENILQKKGMNFKHRLSNQSSKEAKIFDEFVMLKGLLNRIDYAASGHYKIESKSRVQLSQNILETWQEKNSAADWNDLQKWTYEHRDESIVVVGQTGLGKTESGLRWLDNSKAFFVLPLKSAINSIYKRISKIVFQDKSHENLALLHSDMVAKALTENFNNEDDMDKFINEENSWSKQLSIATLDQVFNFVYHYKNYEPKIATLAYAKVVIDEIQMYTPDLLGYLIFGLSEIQRYGGKFQIMTATLPPFLLDLLKDNELVFTQPPQPFLSPNIDHRHKVKVLHKQINADDVVQLDQHQKTLVVCNTVKAATELYSELKEKGISNIHLIHSRFIRKDRNEKENEIMEFGQAENKNSGIWIGTQVVEASLDIDFDLLITELSELCGLFQRMGRCYRKRNYEGDLPNVYVFDGGDKTTSGIHELVQEYDEKNHSVVDYHLFKISKKAIADFDGYLTEKDKLNLINDNYATNRIYDEGCSLIDRVNDCIDYLSNLVYSNTPLSKAEVVDRFRNIDTIDVIPEQVFSDNREEIEEAAQKLNKYLQRKDFDDRIEYKKQYQKLTREKAEARELINNYLVAIPFYISSKLSNRWIENEFLNKAGFRILPQDFNYNSETGLSYKDNESENDEDNFF